jgi:hypothetical protein
MAIAAIPPLFPSVFENQQFTFEVTFVDGAAQIPGASLTESTVSINLPGNEDRNGFPPSLTATVVKFATSSGLILTGFYPKLLNDSDWQVRTTSSNSNIVKYATFEQVQPGYYAGVKYRADSSQSTEIFVRVDTNLGTVFIPQIALNNWTRKRNQVIPFVQGGQVDVNTNRFPGGTLGGSVGQDLFEPAPATGATFVDVLLQFETPGSASFTVPLTVSSVTVRLTAAGGAGGDAYASKDFTGSGGGGGSGGFIETELAVQTNQVYDLQIGAGGDRNGNRRGGITSISRGTFNLSVTGGGAGGDGLPITPGQIVAAGGTAGSPTGIAGRAGTISYTTSNQIGGRGADMFSRDLGTGGAGGTALEPAGRPGFGFGAGGGGAGTQRGTTSPWPAGNGAPGRIEIQYKGARFLFIDNIATNTADYSVRAEALAAGWDGQTPLDARITIESGVYVFSTSTASPAFNYDNLPVNTIIQLTNLGFIIGRGGNGGYASVGTNGGPAMVLNSTRLTITNSGFIAGGGGGGGGAGNIGAGLSFVGGGGGAGGGIGGGGSGGGGGAPGAVGSNGSANTRTGGGGGRILPGAGGAAGDTGPFIFGQRNTPGSGGGAGGGGAATAIDQYGFGAHGTGGNGGGAGNNGQDAVRGIASTGVDYAAGGGGGGGWAAAGGTSIQFGSTLRRAGGLGAKAIETNGFDVNFAANTGTIYGAISGSSTTGVFSTAIVTNQTNLNLRTYTVSQGWNGTATASVTIAGGTYVYSTATTTPGLTVDGSWPNGVKINNYGFILGRGGNGGDEFDIGGSAGRVGRPGGPALNIFLNVSMFNDGFIAGGGGGGAGGGAVNADAGGGGGAGGGNGGAGDRYYFAGGVPGGAGGGPGQAGENGTSADNTAGGTTNDGGGGGGGGGRILPGTGGRGGATFVSNGGEGGRGGGAGGGGGGGMAATGTNLQGGNGGGANNAGGSARRGGGGGGGGWGAPGGRSSTDFSNPPAGGVGGKAINLNGFTITYFKIGTIYGAIA